MNNFNSVKDSGERENFETGSRRDTRKGKGRFDLIPANCMFRVAKHYENGAAKYGDWNWALGQPSTRYLDSAIRHLFNYANGCREEGHLSAVVFNIFGLMWNEEKHKEMIDFYKHLGNRIDESE